MLIKVELGNGASIEYTPSEEEQAQINSLDLATRRNLERKVKTMLELDLQSVAKTIDDAHRLATIDARCRISFQAPAC
jgi:hypothetical protein